MPLRFSDVRILKELRAGFLEVLFLKGLWAGDFGQNRANRGSGLDLRNLKQLAFISMDFTTEYTLRSRICQAEF